MTQRMLTPYDTGETLEPKLWVASSAGLTSSYDNRPDFGKVDFDDEEGCSRFRVQIVRNDPLPATGEEYTIRIVNYTGDPYILQEEE